MKRILALALSLAIMAVIFSRIDMGLLTRLLRETDIPLFAGAMAFFIPQILLTAYRWCYMIRRQVKIGLWESARLVLASNALNILIPSRVGDLAKAYFLQRQGRLEVKRGMNIVIFEKFVDLMSLGLIVLTGIIFDFRWGEATILGLGYGGSMAGLFLVLLFFRIDRVVAHSWFERNKWLAKIKNFVLDTQAYLLELRKNPAELIWILCLSLFLWCLHILQFYVIFMCLNSPVTLFQVFRLVPLAILVGLVPVTLAGVGTRDSAMIYFFHPYDDPARIVGVGLFATLRYFVPGILGLPFLNRYLVKEEPRDVSAGSQDSVKGK